MTTSSVVYIQSGTILYDLIVLGQWCPCLCLLNVIMCIIVELHFNSICDDGSNCSDVVMGLMSNGNLGGHWS